MKTSKSFFVLFLLTPLTLLLGDIINVPADTSTIQGGIFLANEGDTVLVSEGTYYENINFRGKAITVASMFIINEDTSYISKTIIDGSQPTNPDSGSVVYFYSGEDTSSVLCGFTITGGTGQNVVEPGLYDFRGGGGINFKNSGGRIISNKIINNTLSDDNMSIGGGIGAGLIGNEFWIILENNQIMNNSINGINGAYGSGIFLAGNGRLVNNNISYNSCTATQSWAGGGGVHTDASPSLPCTVTIKDNKINYNFVQGSSTTTDPWAAFGGGIKVFRSKVLILNNEISFNQLNENSSGDGEGGGIYTHWAASGSVISSNKIFNNTNNVTGKKYGGGSTPRTLFFNSTNP